jgi:hypothetical protein
LDIGLDRKNYDLVGLSVIWFDSKNPNNSEEGVVTSDYGAGSFGGWEDYVNVLYLSSEKPIQTATWKLKARNPEELESRKKEL